MNCPVCLNPATVPALTGTDFLFETTSRTFTLDSCPACQCLFMDPMPGSDEIAGFYPTQYWWTAAKPGTLKRLESIYRRVALSDHVAFITRAARKPEGTDLLDVGCGSGTLLGLMKQRGFRGVGVDFSAEAASLAEAENGVRVVVGSLADAAFLDQSFDIVTLFHVMEHVANPRNVLAEVFRILRPNGAVVVQVPSIDSWQFKLFGAKWYGLDIPRHVIDYSNHAMLKLLIDSGFVPHRIRHFNLRDNAPAFASSLFPSLDPVSRAVRYRRHNVNESVAAAWVRHFAYLLLVIAVFPLVILESAFGHGATVMIEARKRVDAWHVDRPPSGRP
jgi:2-polyprenyl-3-methyl-5-hydroxy-6-metoxy-1,4-benzoquinol methylase